MVIINENPLQVMIADAIKAFPDECCGFLFGKEDAAGNRIIESALPVINSKEGDKRRRFYIAPKDYVKAELYAVEKGCLLLGVYHSHPDHPAIPSEHDRVAAQPFFSYVILSIVNQQYADIKSWQLNNDSQFEEEIIQLNKIEIWQP
jgi:proteasome lid subunit RPN8/RPN11